MSMSHAIHANKDKNISESVIVGSVRAEIMNYLRDEQPHRFMEITKHLKKHDYVIKRELDILIKRDWVIKKGSELTSRYFINTKKKKVVEFLKRLDATPDTNSYLYPVDVSTDFLAKVLGDAPTLKIKNKQDLIDTFKDPKNRELIEKRAIIKSLPRIKITIAGDKINNFDQYIKGLEEMPDLMEGVIRFTECVREIRNRAIMGNYFNLGEKASDEDFSKMFEEIQNQEFQIIISCKPYKK